MEPTTRTANRRQATRRAALGLLLGALLTLAGGDGEAGAKAVKFTWGGKQNEFTKNCRERGGKPERVTTRVVRCNEPTAKGKTTCNFNTKPAQCTSIAREQPGGGGTGPVGGGTANPNPGGADPGAGNDAGGGIVAPPPHAVDPNAGEPEQPAIQ